MRECRACGYRTGLVQFPREHLFRGGDGLLDIEIGMRFII
jgi:hypothetical protein